MARTPEQIIGKDALLQLIFEGYVVVPAKPTEEMLHSVWLHPIGERRFEGGTNPRVEVVNTDTSASIYRKMVNGFALTSPKQPNE
jgi:hypothetical protein